MNLILSCFRRLLGFGACLLGGAACFFVAFLYLPLLALRPAKFALAFRCVLDYLVVVVSYDFPYQPWELAGHGWVRGHVYLCYLFVFAYVQVRFSILIGPINHIKHLISKERLPFSCAYLASLGLTIYFSVGARSFIGSLVFAIIQVRDPLIIISLTLLST